MLGLLCIVGAGCSPAPTSGPALRLPASTTTGFPIEVDNENFRAVVLESKKPVLVCFGAPWCVPCTEMKPTLKELAREVGQQARVALVDVDVSPSIADQFGVGPIPTMLVVKNGSVIEEFLGTQAKQTLMEALTR